MGLFEDFVNAEMPKRIGTNDDALSVEEGLIPVSTGIGLLTTFMKMEPPNKSFLELKAFVDLSAHRAVIINNFGFADYITLDSWSGCVGISTHSALENENIKIQTFGEIYEVSWNWSVGLPVFALSNGFMSQTPDDEFVVVLGTAISSNKILINLESPILL